MSARNPYTKEEDTHLVEFLAKQCPGPYGRQGNKVYQTLAENPKTYPWGKGHTWQSWRERYKGNKTYFDHRIAKYQTANGIVADVEEKRSSQKTVFTDDDDKYLTKYLAVYCPQKEGRSGNDIYIRLGANADKKWPWSARHPWQSWRYRYMDHAESFDLRIRAYQQKHNVVINASPPKRAANGRQSKRTAKRRKVEDDYDSQETQWTRINWPSPNKNISHPKIASPSKEGEQKVEVRQKARICPVASTSKEQVVDEVERKDEDDRDDDDDDDESDVPRPIGSEDYGGEIFQNGTMGESQGKMGGEMPGIEEDVAGEEETPADESSPALNDRPTASPKQELEKAEAPLHIRDEPEEHLPVDDDLSSSLSPPEPAQPKQHGSFSRNDFTLISQSKRLLNDDPFEDLPPSPHHKPNLSPLKTKHPPAIIEGAFGNRFQKGSKKISMESSTEESSDDEETSALWLPSPRPPRTKESIDRIKAEAMWPPPRVKKSGLEGVTGIQTKVGMERQTAEQRQREKGKQKAVEPDESVVMAARMEVPVNGHHPSALLPIKSSKLSSLNAQDTPAAGPSRTTHVQRRATEAFAPPRPLPEIMGVKSPKRHSTGNMGGPKKSSNSRTINLRQELAQRQLFQQQTPLTTRRSSSGASRLSSSIISEDDDQILQLQQVGFQVVKMFSEEFGFTEDVVLKAWNKVKSLSQLKEVLARMKESADRRMDELMEGLSNVSSTISRKGQNASESFGTSLEFDKKENIDALDFNSSRSSPFAVVYPDPDDSSVIRERRNSSVGGSGNRGRKSLEIRLVDPERASAGAAFVYQPLTGTRAGKFNRLARMGREEEALEREQRRVSSLALSPLRNIPQEQQPRMQGRPEDEIQGVNDDDVLEEIDVPIQDEDSDEDAEMMDVLPGSEEQDQEMGEDRHEVEDRMIKVESDSIQPKLNGQERRYRDDMSEQSELKDAQSKFNGRENVEQEIKIEPEVDSTKSRSAEEVEAMVVVRTDAEKWEEVEDLFRAANRSNMDLLKKIEKEFSADFLKEWLTNKFSI